MDPGGLVDASGWGNFVNYVNTSSPDQEIDNLTHGKTSNALFADFHVSLIRRGQQFDKNWIPLSD